jgi:hypothetical protein
MNKHRERFVILAEKRVSQATKYLRLIGNLANRSNYSYEEKDVKKIIGFLSKELNALKKRFQNQAASQGIEFKL